MVNDTGSTPENPIYKAVTCNGANYGAAATVYGLEELPCEDCSAGLITKDAYKSIETGVTAAAAHVITGAGSLSLGRIDA